MNAILTIIGLPFLAGTLLFMVPGRLKIINGLIALIINMFVMWLAIRLYLSDVLIFNLRDFLTTSGAFLTGFPFIRDTSRYISFNADELSRLIVLFIALFAVLINLYCLAYNRNNNSGNHFYAYFLITIGASNGAAVSDNLLLFLFFWGVLGITLYRLIPGKNEESSATAKKTFILIGASDGIMILGIGIIWMLSGKLEITAVSLETRNFLPVIAFLALLTGSFAKAGAFPFHTWIPDYTRSAPAPSSALLPASLDKLLGIYFLARITTRMFILNEWLVFTMMTIGVVTIIVAVMMALVQHNYKQLLGYHAVSQVGYMILGFGLGSPLGVAAGLFHMINHSIYKSGLLLSAGCVESRTGKENIEEMGGLSKSMPVTFAAALIFALSISGIPPLNGFASKWMIYQGIVDSGSEATLAGRLWFVWLGLAVLGSALTLASFIKFIGGIFLSRRKDEFSHVREVSWLMWLPLGILAIFCLAFGFFASTLVIPRLIPCSGTFEFSGTWNSSFILILFLVSILLGAAVYLSGAIKKFRTEDSFIGGEKIQDQTGFPTTGFYTTISEFGPLAWLYRKASEKWFDIYDLSRQLVLWISHRLSLAHTGVLPFYAFWVIFGLVIMMILMVH